MLEVYQSLAGPKLDLITKIPTEGHDLSTDFGRSWLNLSILVELGQNLTNSGQGWHKWRPKTRLQARHAPHNHFRGKSCNSNLPWEPSTIASTKDATLRELGSAKEGGMKAPRPAIRKWKLLARLIGKCLIRKHLGIASHHVLLFLRSVHRKSSPESQHQK